MSLTTIRAALRTQLLTASVVSTPATSLSATATGYARASGSFVTDGWVPGLEATPSGFTSNTATRVVSAVSALALTIAGGCTVEAAAGGRSLSMGLPVLRAWDGVRFGHTASRLALEESFVPGPRRLLTMAGTNGVLELTGLYVLKLYGLENVGSAPLEAVAAAILACFPAESTLALANGDAVRIRGDVAPLVSGLLPDVPGWLAQVVTVPWRLYTLNA